MRSAQLLRYMGWTRKASLLKGLTPQDWSSELPTTREAPPHPWSGTLSLSLSETVTAIVTVTVTMIRGISIVHPRQPTGTVLVLCISRSIMVAAGVTTLAHHVVVEASETDPGIEMGGATGDNEKIRPASGGIRLQQQEGK